MSVNLESSRGSYKPASMKKLNLSGEKFGRLLVLSETSKRGKHVFWLCQCSCGNQIETKTTSLRQSRTRSCGCLRTEMVVERSLTHGQKRNFSTSKELKSWEHAKQRCFNPKNAKFKNYGGRGITMCEEWTSDFGAFFKAMGCCPKGHTLDRIDVNGDYAPGNCRWATSKQQAVNRTDNVFLEFRGQTLTISQLAEICGLSNSRTHSLIRYKNKDPEEVWDIAKKTKGK